MELAKIPNYGNVVEFKLRRLLRRQDLKVQSWQSIGVLRAKARRVAPPIELYT